MAKKFGKLLLFTAAVGALAAGTYYYLQNKTPKLDDDDDDFDDFDEYDDDLDDEDAESERSYVSLDLENAAPESGSSTERGFKAENNVKTEDSSTGDTVSDAPVQESEAPKAGETVEEFFDDEDPSMDAM